MWSRLSPPPPTDRRPLYVNTLVGRQLGVTPRGLPLYGSLTQNNNNHGARPDPVNTLVRSGSRGGQTCGVNFTTNATLCRHVKTFHANVLLPDPIRAGRKRAVDCSDGFHVLSYRLLFTIHSEQCTVLVNTQYLV